MTVISTAIGETLILQTFMLCVREIFINDRGRCPGATKCYGPRRMDTGGRKGTLLIRLERYVLYSVFKRAEHEKAKACHT
jgi:hypothetical protein